MMSRNDNDSKKNNTGSFIENNKFVLIFSFFIAIFCWVIVSMYETPETERIIQNVKVQITGTEELQKEYGLSVYDTEEYTVDVTVRGPSYQVNSSSFSADNLSITAPCDTIVSAGTFPLTIQGAVINNVNNIEISKFSKNSINVYFDKEVEKKFNLSADIKELEGYSLAEGMIREKPVLSKKSVVIAGPSREINKITSVKAHIELNSVLNSSEKYDAEIIPVSESATINNSNITVKTKGPFYITIPVNHTGKYNTAVSFKNAPDAFEKNPIKYTVSPSVVEVTVAAGLNSSDINGETVNVGEIDFNNIIGGKVNYFTIENANLDKENKNYTVTVDASSYYVLWSTVSVDLSDVKVPANVNVLTKDIVSVRLVGPEKSLLPVNRNIAYAVPVLDNVSELSKGIHSVPAKIKFRSTDDCWVYGNYTIDIEIK